VWIALIRAGRLVTRVDSYGLVAIIARNAGNKRLDRGDLQFEHFNLSHSRRQTNTALKFAPKTSATERKTGGFWTFRRQSFIQFSFSFLSPNWKALKTWSLKLVAGGGFEPPTFGLCDLTQLSLRVGLYLRPVRRDARHPVSTPSPIF